VHRASGGSSLERLSVELGEAVARVGGSGSWSAERLKVLLARAEFRAFRVDRCLAPRVCAARCPVSDDAARVAWIRPLRSRGGALGPGAWIVGRALPVAPGRWVFIGRPIVAGAGAPVEALAGLLRSLQAPRGEFWNVHGAVIVRSVRAARDAR
jgi:hypothetical protein